MDGVILDCRVDEIGVSFMLMFIMDVSYLIESHTHGFFCPLWFAGFLLSVGGLFLCVLWFLDRRFLSLLDRSSCWMELLNSYF